jgi:uncharacterized protein (TIGR02266 family)
VSDEPAGGDPLHLIPDFHRSTRMPLDAVVRLHFEGTVAYQNGFAANVSALGMFVKHPEPPPVGTRLVFEFVLGEERKPVQGAGVVAWVRERYEGPGRPAGVGISFTELDALSRQHIAESLFEYLEAQLGVEVADHPDVPDLLAAVPRRSDASLELEPTPLPAVHEPARPAAESKPEPPSLTFQIFEEPAAEPGVAEAAAGDLFAVAVPPDDATASGYAVETGSAGAARPSGPWLPLAIGAAVILAALAAWWFLAGPGSLDEVPLETAANAPETATAAEPPRPALDPEPGPEETLAETVGVEEPAVDPGAPAPEAAAAAAESAVTPAPPPADAETAPLAPAEAPASDATEGLRLAEIAWDSSPGSTVVSLIGNTDFRAGGYRFYEMQGERPRLLLRLTGMAAGYPRPGLTVGTEELAGVRIGYHEKPAGNELHVVFDLAAPGVRVSEVALENGRIVVRLTRPD